MKRALRWVRYTSLVLGILMLVGGIVGYFLVRQEPDHSGDVVTTVKDLQNKALNGTRNALKADYTNDITFASGQEVVDARRHYESSVQDYGIGTVYMPSVDISVPLLAGTSEWNLFNGIATGRENQRLGEGLFIGLSHNLKSGTLITKIRDMAPGDLVYITDFKNVYIYETVERKVVHQTESKYFKEPLEDEAAKLLIYRCEGEVGTDWRQIVYADFIEQIPVEEMDSFILNGLLIDIDENNGVNDKNNLTGDVVTSFEQGTDTISGVNLKPVKNDSSALWGYFDALGRFCLILYGFASATPYLFAGVNILFFIVYRVI